MIKRTKDRIAQTGEVFTPLPLVDELLNKLPEETWTPDKTYLDPSCGDGNFLVRVIAFKIFKGSTVEQALSTTYGVDLMSDNINHCKQRVLIHAFVANLVGRKKLLKHISHTDELDFSLHHAFHPFFLQYKHIVNRNIVCHDALTYNYEFDKEFDDIIPLQSFDPPEHPTPDSPAPQIEQSKKPKSVKQSLSLEDELKKINEILQDPDIRADFKEYTKWNNKKTKLIKQINGF